jgi:hypothetical protein
VETLDYARQRFLRKRYTTALALLLTGKNVCGKLAFDWLAVWIPNREVDRPDQFGQVQDLTRSQICMIGE